MEKIEFDFVAAKKQAEEIQNISLRCKQLINSEYSETIKMIDRAWKGDNGKELNRKLCRQLEKMNHLAKKIEQSEEALGNACLKAQTVENQVKELAES